MMRHSRTAFLALTLWPLAVVPTAAAPPSQTPSPEPAAGQAARAPYYSEGMEGVDLRGLTEPQREMALRVLNSSPCTCGCAMTVAQCRVEDQNCPVSPGLARAIVDAVRRGEDEAAVRQAYRMAASAAHGAAAPASSPPATAAPTPAPSPRAEIPVDGSPVQGPEDAPVTIVAFSDFQCPFCARAVPIVREVMKEFSGQVRLVFKHLPLEIHPMARSAAAAAEAAARQGRFWEMHDRLFADRGALNEANLREHARGLGLDLERFDADRASEEASSRLRRDLAEAHRLQVGATPTFFVNGRRLPAYTATVFRRAVEAALAESPSAAPMGG